MRAIQEENDESPTGMELAFTWAPASTAQQTPEGPDAYWAQNKCPLLESQEIKPMCCHFLS